MTGLGPKREAGGVFVVFATYYLGAGILIPFFPLWLSSRALQASDISFILSAPLIVRTMAAPLFGYVGDRFGQRNVVRATTAIGLAAGCCLPFASPFWPIMVLAAITYIAWQSAPLQMDAIAIGLIRRKIVSSYGTIRAFGSTAFIVANLTGGLVVGSFGTDAVLIYFLAVASLLLLATLFMPASAQAESTDQPPPVGGIWRPAVISVLVAVALVQCAHSTFMSFGALHMRDLGYSDSLIGVVLGTATAAEVAIFVSGPLIRGRIRPTSLIMLGASVAVLRWIAVAFVEAPALLLLLQASHAITFGGTYLGLIGFMVESVDPRKVARTQGVYIAMFGGFNALLTLAVGNAYDAIGSLAFLASAVPRPWRWSS